MRRNDGSARFAFVTFLMMNDSYLASALLLAHGLKEQGSEADAVCLVTEEISDEARYALGLVYDRVIAVEKFVVPHRETRKREDRPLWFTRLNALRLGGDGDLGCDYEKVLILDADVLPLRHFDHLFSLRAPAGILNEQKHYCLETSDNGAFVFPPSIVEVGKWNWHRRYEPECAHGERIPTEVTDRVRVDTTNLGLNGSLYLFDTSATVLEEIRRDVERPEIRDYVGDLFKWPDMQYLTMHFSGEWTSIDIKFSSFNGYPNLGSICGCHYSGFKPWHFNKKSIEVYKGFEDFRFWYESFIAMEDRYPDLLRVKLLANTSKRSRQALGMVDVGAAEPEVERKPPPRERGTSNRSRRRRRR